jgi:hypothetical protein
MSTAQVEAYRKVFSGPLPDAGWVVIAFDGDIIVGFSTLQPIWHVGGTWVDVAQRGSNLFSRLINELLSTLPAEASGALVTTDNPKLQVILPRLGLEQVFVSLYRWLRR